MATETHHTGAALPREPSTAEPYRVLVVANETVEGRPLLEEIERRTAGKPAQVRVIAPALVGSRLKHGLGDVDEAREQAKARLQRTVDAIRRAGVEVSGDVGDSDPNLAIRDALALFPADEVIISTHPPERSTWLEKDVVEKAREEIEQPITHVVVDLGDETHRSEVKAVERIPRRRRRRGEGDGDESDYLPPMQTRDRLTLLVGITGTVALGILAMLCPDGGEVSGGCAVRFMIALGAFMFTVWHAVALLVMGSVRYRGFWQDAAADIVLYGIPPAIVISALLG
jgi:GABA permease